MTILTDVSTKGWGEHCNGISTGRGGMVKKKTKKNRQGHHINVLELMALNLQFWLSQKDSQV